MTKVSPASWAEIKAWLVSQLYALWSILVFAVTWGVTQGQIHGWQTFFAFLEASSFSVFVALVFGIGPYARGAEARSRSQNTVPLEGGGSAVLQPTTQPPSPHTATATLVASGQ